MAAPKRMEVSATRWVTPTAFVTSWRPYTSTLATTSSWRLNGKRWGMTTGCAPGSSAQGMLYGSTIQGVGLDSVRACSALGKAHTASVTWSTVSRRPALPSPRSCTMTVFAPTKARTCPRGTGTRRPQVQTPLRIQPRRRAVQRSRPRRWSSHQPRTATHPQAYNLPARWWMAQQLRRTTRSIRWFDPSARNALPAHLPGPLTLLLTFLF